MTQQQQQQPPYTTLKTLPTKYGAYSKPPSKDKPPYATTLPTTPHTYHHAFKKYPWHGPDGLSLEYVCPSLKKLATTLLEKVLEGYFD